MPVGKGTFEIRTNENAAVRESQIVTHTYRIFACKSLAFDALPPPSKEKLVGIRALLVFSSSLGFHCSLEKMSRI